jgi:hypothetical protein
MDVLGTRHFFASFYIILYYQTSIEAGYEMLIRNSESQTSRFIIVVDKNLQKGGMEGKRVDAIWRCDRYC